MAAGNDTLEGGEGNDNLRDEYGTNSILGGAGSDQIWISASDSYIAGGSLNGNNAFADGGADNDNIHFGSLQNQATIIGGTGSDYIAQTSFNNQQHYAKQVTIYADGVSGETVDDGNDNISLGSRAKCHHQRRRG